MNLGLDIQLRQCGSCIRVLRGEALEALEAVSRDIQVLAHELEVWRRDFLDGAVAKLRSRSGDSAERALKQAQAKVGELTMKLELVERLLEKRGYGEELARLKRSPGR